MSMPVAFPVSLLSDKCWCEYDAGFIAPDAAPTSLCTSLDELCGAFYRAAISAGGKDNGPPGLRAHYHPNYYGAFVLDPDGHNIEAVCHTPA
jgi:hypothetical protein